MPLHHHDSPIITHRGWLQYWSQSRLKASAQWINRHAALVLHPLALPDHILARVARGLLAGHGRAAALHPAAASPPGAETAPELTLLMEHPVRVAQVAANPIEPGCFRVTLTALSGA
jgi:hypothetical protein